MNRTVYIPECIDEKLALKILKTELIGTDYVHTGVYSPYQLNALLVKNILEKYIKADVELLDGKVYGDGGEQ